MEQSASSEAHLAKEFLEEFCVLGYAVKSGESCHYFRIYFYQTRLCYIPEDRTLHSHCCENLITIKKTFSFIEHAVSLSCS
jgi:hypothetical protein